MARRVLSPGLGASLLLVLSLASCRHRDPPQPSPSASASALGHDFTLNARERHFQDELARARARFQTKQELGDCAKALREKPDLELCQAAASSLAALTGEPTQPPELALTRLAPSALALVRLSERARYLSLAELAQRHMDGDAGAPPPPSAASPSPAAASSVLRPHVPKGQPTGHHDQQHALERRDGPVSRLLERSVQLEREVIRNLGAYLEYGPLPVRRAAFEAAKRLRAQHPNWPALDHLLREAAVLESDDDLQRELRDLSVSGRSAGGGGG